MTDRFMLEERQSEDGYEYWFALVDSYTGEEIGADGGEPEDQSLVRDWAWVPDVLNKLAQELTTAMVERDEAMAEVERWKRGERTAKRAVVRLGEELMEVRGKVQAARDLIRDWHHSDGCAAACRQEQLDPASDTWDGDGLVECECGLDDLVAIL